MRLPSISFTLFILVSAIACLPSDIHAQTYQQVSSWGGPGGGGGLFNWPLGVAIDKIGNIYVADPINNRIQKFSSDGSFILMWGRTGNSSVDLSDPIGVAVDTAGTVYVGSRHASVKKFKSDGTYLGDLPVVATGIAVGKDGAVYTVGDTVTKFNQQGMLVSRFGRSGNSIAVDDSGFVYVVAQKQIAVGQDSLVIYRFSRGGVLVSNWSQGPLSARHSPILFGIVVDSAKYVYVGIPFQAIILKYTVMGAIAGQISCGDNPRGIALTSAGNLVVASYRERKIQVLSKQGAVINSWGQSGGMGDGYLNYPLGLALDTYRGYVCVTDYWDARVQRFSFSGQFLDKWGLRTGSTDEMLYPEGIAVDKSGRVYVNDVGRDVVRVYDASGVLLKSWGGPGSDPGQFLGNSAIAVDNQNFVFDTHQHDRVQKLTWDGSFVLQWGTHGNGDGQFSGARGIGVDHNGNVYVVDHGTYGEQSQVQKFSSVGSFITKWTLGVNQWDGSPRISGVSFDKSGNVFIVDDGTGIIYKFTPNGVMLSSWVCASPRSLGVDDDGNVYVVSSPGGASKVIKYAPLPPQDYSVVDFGYQPQGDSTEKSIMLRNPYASQLSIFGLTTSTQEFSPRTTLPIVIPSFDSVQISIRFFPRIFGHLVDTLIVRSDVGSFKIPLSGDCPYPVLSLGTRFVDFGDVAKGAVRSQTLVIKNLSINTLLIDSATTQTRWFGALLQKHSVTSTDSLALALYFTPDSIRPYVDTLVLYNNSLTNIVKVPLAGNSPKPLLSTSSLVLTLPQVAVEDSVTKSLWLYNRSANMITVSGITNVSQLFSASRVAPFQIHGFDSAEVRVKFKPKSYGDASDLITITSDGGTIKVLVNGTSPYPYLAFRQQRLDFWVLSKDSTRRLMLTIVDTSINPLRIDTLYTKTKYFELPFQLNPATVKKGDSLNYIVTFTPDSPRVFIDTIYVQSNSLSAVSKIGLRGEGTLVITSVLAGELPSRFTLHQNYPNPFNASTTIDYELPKEAVVTLRIFNTLGQVIATLADEHKETGSYRVQWNAHVPSGVYFYRLQAGEFVETKKMILLR
jgi:sugar lactone lactonase YvrE